MDKEFLMDYEAKEKEEIKKFAQKFREGKIGAKEVYPQKYRLKLNKPYTTSIAGEWIWTQIPLYGTTIIALQPARKEIFKKIHGFDTEDIDRLIDFVKESGRIQFALDDYPTQYIKMDYLEPLFRELKPPKLTHLTLDCIITDEEIENYSSEIGSLLENPQSLNSIKKYIKKKYPQSTISQDVVKQGLLDDLVRLKVLGHEDLVEDYVGWLATVDAMECISLLQAIHDMFLYPYDLLKGIQSFKRQEIHRLHRQFPSFDFTTNKEIGLPYEVGIFLNDKLDLIRLQNLKGSIELSDTYDLYDLRKVMNALNEAVEEEKIDKITEKSKEISLIFENVWDDTDKLKERINKYRYRISFGFGIIGALAGVLAAGPIGGVGGIFTGLGFAVADKYWDIKTYPALSEKIAKLRTQNQIIHVYDFRKKYKLL
jgi:hypothetical protein